MIAFSQNDYFIAIISNVVNVNILTWKPLQDLLLTVKHVNKTRTEENK